MINSVTISNFQSHKKTKIKFHKGINMIVGSSDSGKSSIIRALNWVMYNKPSGEAFRSNWGGDTKIILKLSEKVTIKRHKGKPINIYQMYPTGKEDKRAANTFSSFGQDVPEEIKNTLNFSSLNIASQFDSPFLLAMSGGEVARYLNKIVNLDKIDSALFNINSTLRQENSELKNKSDQLKEAELNILNFNWVVESEGCLVGLENNEKILLDKIKKSNKLLLVLNNIEEINKTLNELPNVSKYEKEVNKLIERVKKLQDTNIKIKKLEDIIDNIENYQHSLIEWKERVSIWEEEFGNLMPKECPLCGNFV